MIFEGLHKLLAADTTLKALLGNARGDKTDGIFPMVAPKEVTVPYVVYLQVRATPLISYAGANRLTYTRWRYLCHAADYTTAKKVAEAVKGVLNGYKGTLTDSQATPVESSFLAFESDSVDQDLKATIYNCVVDIDMQYVDKG